MEMKPITIVGCGPGAMDHVTPAVLNAIRRADVLVGAPRLLELFPESVAERIVVRSQMPPVLDAIAARIETSRVVVLVTGDPGLCSFAAPVVRRFGREACHVIAGISSVNAAFAALGIDWLGARILSAHNLPPELQPATLSPDEKIGLLAGNAANSAWVEALIDALFPTHDIFLCENMTLPDESITHLTSVTSPMNTASRSIFIFTRKEAQS